MRIRSTALAGILAGMLVASLAGGAAAQSTAPASSIANTSWLLATVGGKPVASGVNADILFTDAEAGGFAGCNRFSGSYTSDGASTLTIGPLATTMILCDDATNTFEQSYLSALATVASYAIGADGGLTLSDASGAAVLTYGATAPASVEGPWIVTSFNNGNNGVETVPDGMGASVTFQPDGSLGGFDGCNSFGGGYGVEGDAIAIGPLMGTLIFCDDATNTFAQQFRAALEAATKWAIVSGALELRDASGALQVGASSAIGH